MYQIKFISKPKTQYNPAYGFYYDVTLETGHTFEACDDELIGIFGFYSNVQDLVGRVFADVEVSMFTTL
jgi:hypothetical protein